MLRLLPCPLVCALLVFCVAPARAMVGATQDGGAYSAHVVMVLAQKARGAGFCSAAVLAPRIVLTAAHCVAEAATTRVHFRDGGGAPVLLAVRRIERHPLYRADAVEARARSVDLALVETAEPLPGSFSAVSLADAPAEVGAEFDVAGFGVTREGVAASSGALRSARLRLRAPLSNLLLWLEGDGAGACTGDSGAPVFSDGALAGVVAFAEGAAGRGCGKLTQAVRVAPARAWIEKTIAAWR